MGMEQFHYVYLFRGGLSIALFSESKVIENDGGVSTVSRLMELRELVPRDSNISDRTAGLLWLTPLKHGDLFRRWLAPGIITIFCCTRQSLHLAVTLVIEIRFGYATTTHCSCLSTRKQWTSGGEGRPGWFTSPQSKRLSMHGDVSLVDSSPFQETRGCFNPERIPST